MPRPRIVITTKKRGFCENVCAILDLSRPFLIERLGENSSRALHPPVTSRHVTTNHMALPLRLLGRLAGGGGGGVGASAAAGRAPPPPPLRLGSKPHHPRAAAPVTPSLAAAASPFRCRPRAKLLLVPPLAAAGRPRRGGEGSRGGRARRGGRRVPARRGWC